MTSPTPVHRMILEKLKIDPEKRAKKDPITQRKKKGFLIIFAVFALGIFLLYRYYRHAVPVAVRPLEVREVGLPTVVLTAGGYIIADPQVLLSSRTVGKIEKLFVKEGDKVKKGDVLATILAPDLKSQYEEAKLANETAQRQLVRMRKLYREGIIAKRDFEVAALDAEAQGSRYEAAKFNYEESQIRAPIDGTVIQIMRDEGEFLSPGITASGDPGSVILKMGNLMQMKVDLDVSENDIAKIWVNQPVLIFPDAISRATLRGHVIEISPMADRQKSVVPIKIQMEATELNLKPEMSARILFLEKEMEGEVERAILIPETAVRRFNERNTVFVVEEERALEREIVLGEKAGKMWKIKSGLRAGEALVLDPPVVLRNGRRVEIKSE